MGHRTSKNYYNLQKRLDSAPHGAPLTDTLIKILELLFTKEEAELVSILPINFFTVAEAAKIWNKTKEETQIVLDDLVDKGLLFDVRKGDVLAYMVIPPMFGFFEFVLMRTNGKIDKKLVSELIHQYVGVEDKFKKEVFSVNPSMTRALVQEDTIQPKDMVVVLDYERVSHLIKTSSCIGVGDCFCQRLKKRVGKGCEKPRGVCLSLNKSAESLVRHKSAKKISKKEALGIIKKCMKLGLVQTGDNVQEGVNFLCNCCSCCCEVLSAYKKLGYNSKMTSNFEAKSKVEKCIGCGTCVERCPVGAIKLHEDGKGKKYAKTNPDICIGCGACARFCPTKGIVMERRKETVFVPKDSFERYVLSAIDKGRLQNLIFDNYHIWTYEMLRRFFGIILSLEPAKRLLAQRQIRSRYLNAAVKMKIYDLYGKLYNDGKKPDYSHPELQKRKS